MKLHFGASTTGMAAGRILLASLFLLGGVNKLINYSSTQALMTDHGVVPAAYLLPLTILLEMGGGLALTIGRRGTTTAAFLLAAFALATNLFFHDFWNVDAAMRATQLSLFLKNIAISGGLIFVGASRLRMPHA